MAKVLGMTSVYLEDLISPLDFEKESAKYDSAEIKKILDVSILPFCLRRHNLCHFHLNLK